MKTIEFGRVLRKEREIRKISRRELAEELAKSGGTQKGMEGQLSRFESEQRVPSERKVFEIADALSSRADDSDRQKDLLLSQLMQAANKELTEPGQIEYLDEKCAPALLKAGLDQHQVRTILDRASVATKQRIAEAAINKEEISFVELGGLASELQNTAVGYSNEAWIGNRNADVADHVISAGRARILVAGEVSDSQKTLLMDIAKVIKTVLNT